MAIWKVKKRQKEIGKNQQWLVSWLRTGSWIDTKLDKYQLVGKGYFAKKNSKKSASRKWGKKGREPNSYKLNRTQTKYATELKLCRILLDDV